MGDKQLELVRFVTLEYSPPYWMLKGDFLINPTSASFSRPPDPQIALQSIFRDAPFTKHRSRVTPCPHIPGSVRPGFAAWNGASHTEFLL